MPIPETLTFKVTNKQIGNKKVNEGTINANDWVGGIEIYNAADWSMTVPFGVEATLDDGSKVVLADAVYDKVTDRLVYSVGHSTENEVHLANLDNIVFTRKSS
jgi:hypothetical protein